MSVVLTAVTPLIGNTLLEAGGKLTAIVSVPGATVATMTVEVAPQTYPGDGITWQGYVSAAGQVTVIVTAVIATYALASVYNILVLTGTSGGSGPVLETNGTPNSSQALLNLVAGAGVTLTDEGAGSIEIAASVTPLSLETNGTPNSSQALLNLVAGAGVTLTDEGAGSIEIAASVTPLSLETNGTPNSSQALLNLVAGTGITITDEGAGSIEVAATGGGGGGPTAQNVVTGTRSIGAVFQNTSGKPMWVTVTVSLPGGVNGLNMLTDASNPPTTVVASIFGGVATAAVSFSFVVLPGNFYELAVSVGAGFTLDTWIEWV
jgi:hypothetical protein